MRPGEGLALGWRRPPSCGDGLAPGRQGPGVYHPRSRRLAAPDAAGEDDMPMGARLAAHQPNPAPHVRPPPRVMVPARCGGVGMARRRSSIDRGGTGVDRPRPGAAMERPAFVAEIIGRVGWRGEVLRPRRLDGAPRGAGQGDRKRRADGERRQSKAPAHRLFSFASACQSAKLMRSIRNRSLVRAYQPLPCMRPTRRILSVAT